MQFFKSVYIYGLRNIHSVIKNLRKDPTANVQKITYNQNFHSNFFCNFKLANEKSKKIIRKMSLKYLRFWVCRMFRGMSCHAQNIKSMKIAIHERFPVKILGLRITAKHVHEVFATRIYLWIYFKGGFIIPLRIEQWNRHFIIKNVMIDFWIKHFR